MKEHKSHMSLVARFAYIFATIVTIFAQMGLAPLIETRAVTNDPVVTMKTDKNGYNTAEALVMTFSSTTTDPIDLAIPNSLQYIGTDASSGVSTTSTGITVTPRSANTPIKLVFKVTKALDKAGVTVAASYTYTTGFGFFATKHTDPVGDIQITSPGNMDSSKVTGTTTTALDDVKLSIPGGAKIARDKVTNAVTDAKVTVHIAGSSAMNGTVYQTGTNSTALAVGTHFTLTWAGTGLTPIQSTITDNNKSWEKNMNDLGFYFSWDLENDRVIVTAGKAIAAGWTMDMPFSMSKDAADLTFTVTDDNGNPTDTVTTPGPTSPTDVDGTQFSMIPKYAAPFDYGTSTATQLSDFPFFYMTDTDTSKNKLYSFIAYTNYSNTEGGDNAAANDLLSLRKGILAGTPFASIPGKAKSSNSTRESVFENFHQIDPTTGSIIAGTEKKFTVGKTYTLNQYDPLSGNPTRFKRLNTTFASKDWYMPDGIPTFTVKADGTIALDQTNAAGKSIPNTWSVDETGKKIINKFYHVKKVQVVDQNGDPVEGAKLTMKTSTTGASTMYGTTGKDGTGDLYPSDYVDANKGPFYWANGAESFGDLSLPTGYTKENLTFSSLSLDPSTDYLKVEGAPYNDDKQLTAEVTDSTTDANFRKNQILTLRVHKYVAADKDITIKKVSQSNTATVLGGATFKIAEQNNTTDPVNTTTTATDAATGLTTDSTSIAQTSNTKTRVFKITEDAVPSGYSIGNDKGYYATWVKGTGFTGVGDSATTTTTQVSADGLATVSNGQLQIADPSIDRPGGGDSKMKIQYVDAARWLDATNKAGTTIAGAQLPVLDPTVTYSGTGLEGFSGLGGIIYNSDNAAPTGQTADIMTGSTQVSGTSGLGTIQSLWSVNGLVSNWQALITNKATNGWILRNAIATNTIPASPAIFYQLLTKKQMGRATNGSGASDYYTLGSTIAISSDGTTLKAANATSAQKGPTINKSNYRDNPVTVDPTTGMAKIELYKVKHVRIVDTAGTKIPNVQVNFTKMSATTGADGSDGELTPTDGTFVFPDGSQYLTGVKTSDGKTTFLGADGAALDSTNGSYFAFQTGGVDKLQVYSGKDVTTADDGQTIVVTVQSPTTIKIHKQSKTNAATSLADAKFQVWTTDGGVSKAVTTPSATDANGNTSVTLTNPDSKGSYHIKEVANPTGYAPDSNTYNFTASAKGVVSATDDTTKTVSVASDGTLNFADMPDGSGGVGDNGSNGGKLTINKVNADTTSADTPPDGAQFTVKEITAGATGTLASGTDVTTANGKATLNLGSPTTATRLFTITEKAAPSGYLKNSNTYTLKIDPTGTMSLGQGTDASKITNTTGTDDGVIKFVSATNHALNFADSKQTITIHKQDFANAATALSGATFTIAPSSDLSATATGTTDASGNTTIALAKVDTNSKYIVTETTAPAGYTAASPVTVTTDSNGKLTATSDNNATAISNNVLKVKDVKKGTGPVGDNGTNGGTLTISKIDSATGTSLAGAKFTVKEQLSGTYSGSATTDATGKATFNLGDPITSDRLFMISENNAPAGYTASPDTYYLRITATGQMYLGNPDSGATPPSLATQTTDGKLKFASTTDHTIKFADDVNSPITLKKVDTNGTALSGATFKIFHSDSVGATNGSEIYNSLTTTADGTTQFTPQASDQDVHYYRIQELQAPAGYDKGSDALIVYQNGKITGIKSLNQGDKAGDSYGPVTKTGDQAITYTDKQSASDFTYALHVRQQDGNSTSSSLITVNEPVTINVKKAGSSATPLPLSVDSTSGNATITTKDLAKYLGLSNVPSTGSVDLQVSVDPSVTDYTLPAPRTVTFTWGANGGFTVPAANKDGMMVDGSDTKAQNNTDVLKTGDLRLLFRQDTIVPQSTAQDTNDHYPLVPNAEFVLSYNDDGTQLGTQTVTTNDAGVAVVQAPTASDTFTGTLPLGKRIEVTMTQVTAPKGYQILSQPVSMWYNSAAGFTAFQLTPFDLHTGYTGPQVASDRYSPNTGNADTTVSGISATTSDEGYDPNPNINVTQYSFGGTQVIVPMTPNPASATLTDVPRVMNFGKAEISARDQTLNLLASSDTTNAANFDTSTLNDADAVTAGTATDDKDTAGNTTGFLNAAVTQTGTLTGGWRLDMSMSDLTSQGGGDTVSGGSVSMAAPSVTLTPSSSASPDTAGMGIAASTVKMDSTATAQSVANTGSDSAPGDYKIAWKLSDVKMSLPAFSGKLNTNYHSLISWDFTVAP